MNESTEGSTVPVRTRGRSPSHRVGRSPEPEQRQALVAGPTTLPILLTATETAAILRTTRVALYAMVARAQVPGVTRIGRRVLFRSGDLLDWLDQKRAPSSKE